jgi:hypothetical protein
MPFEAVIKPLTPRVPAIDVFPLDPITKNLSVLTAKLAPTPRLPPTEALLVTDKPVPDAVNDEAPEKVLAEVPD